MPELPEVEAVCRVARRALAHRRIIAASIYRPRICAPLAPPELIAAVLGGRCRSVGRLGKNILVHVNGVILAIHLRMTGNLYPLARSQTRPPGAVAEFELDNGRRVVFDDRRGLGMMRLVGPEQLGRLLASIGVDPLSQEFTAARFVGLAGRSRAAIKTFLMDQRRVAGLGNIYAAEALHRAGIDPRRRASSLSRARLASLHAAIIAVLRRAVQSAARAYRRPGQFDEAESSRLAVYGREGEPCHRCRLPIRRVSQAGRSTYFCSRCQR